MEGNRLVGIFTERGYAREFALHRESSKDLKVQDVMTADVLCVSPGRTGTECMALIAEKRTADLPSWKAGR